MTTEEFAEFIDLCKKVEVDVYVQGVGAIVLQFANAQESRRFYILLGELAKMTLQHKILIPDQK